MAEPRPKPKEHGDMQLKMPCLPARREEELAIRFTASKFDRAELASC